MTTARWWATWGSFPGCAAAATSTTWSRRPPGSTAPARSSSPPIRQPEGRAPGQPEGPPPCQRGRLRFAGLGYALAVLLTGTNLATPLYATYEHVFRLSPLDVTLLVAVYAAAVVV